MKYKKKPVVIEALKFNTEIDYIVMVAKWGNEFESKTRYKELCFVCVDTLEGQMICAKGDYIIKGVKGEFYPCKPDIFEMTYDKVEDLIL